MFCIGNHMISSAISRTLEECNFENTISRTLEEFVNHSPAARDLQILLVFYQHPLWFINL